MIILKGQIVQQEHNGSAEDCICHTYEYEFPEGFIKKLLTKGLEAFGIIICHFYLLQQRK